MGWCWRQRKLKIVRHAWLSTGLGFPSFLAASPVLGEAAGQTGVAAGLRGYADAAELTLIAGLTVFSGLAAILYLDRKSVV